MLPYKIRIIENVDSLPFHGPGRRNEQSMTKLKRFLCAGMLVAVLAAASTLRSQVNPLSSHVEISGVKNYSGATLPKPKKILVYDFTINSSDVQVDKTQEYRLRHLIRGDENQKTVGENAVEELAKELLKSLKKTGIPVERARDSIVPGANDIAVRGNFVDVKEGEKTERVTLGMGAGSAEVKTTVDVHYQTPAGPVAFSQFNTDTTMANNLGAAEPMAAGLNPAAAAAKATVGDRKKNVHAYATNTADAIAKQLTAEMASAGWLASNK
jgi:hypothetical protein